MNANLIALRDHLVDLGMRELTAPRELLSFTGDAAPDSLINDIEGHPHAFVLAALVDRQVDAQIAWRLPFKVRERHGSFELDDLARLSTKDWDRLLQGPPALHRFCTTMARVLHDGVQRIGSQYAGDASAIWSDNPTSKVVVGRFRQFYGAGPKISTMAANLLVRVFHVRMTEYREIDISADVQVCRVMGRVGFVADGPSVEAVVQMARKLHPEFPGIFDLAMWNIGRNVCHPTSPDCPHCELNDLCAYAHPATLGVGQQTIDTMGADLAKLAALRDQGLIDAADYDAKKSDWLKLV